MPPTYKLLVVTGTYTMVQALFQFLFSLLAIAQHFCVVNFLRSYPILIYIRMMYFYNPSSCGGDINIGQSLDGVANEAYVYLASTPLVSTRALIFSCISVGLSMLWAAGSYILMKGRYRQHHYDQIHWPWVVASFLVALQDIVAVICYANDSYQTSTLQDTLAFINGVGSGFGSANPSTIWASRTMLILHGRLGIFLIINLGLLVATILDCTRFRTSTTSTDVPMRNQSMDISPDANNVHQVEAGSDSPATSEPNTEQEPMPKIPRPGLSQSFRSMKDMLFGSSDSLDNKNRNRVNFLREETTSDPVQPQPQSFENLIAEQQRRLRGAMVDTGGRRPSLQAARSLPQLSATSMQETPRGGRGATGQLPGQMPWAYIAGANRMRDQLPPDEDLPPVPLPDYTAFQSHRKASVHRAASSLSSLTQKKDYTNTKSHRIPR